MVSRRKIIFLLIKIFWMIANISDAFGSKIIIVEDAKACFRRVLAGKRIAPHWVRRTLACERVEDCMHECGHEKRFTCEGFNYRLDPSGQGQGVCELIEVPLSQMDVYTSTQTRDANLLRHPDYDYYERDRNAPSSCRQACTDCSIKPATSPPVYYRPSYPDKPPPYIPSTGGSGYGYRPLPPSSSGTAIDKYRPQRPSSPGGGSIPPSSYDNRAPVEYHHYDFSSHGYDDKYNKPAYGSIDRYDTKWQVQNDPSGYGGHSYHSRPDHFKPPYLPGPDYSPYRDDNRFAHVPPPSYGYEDRDTHFYRKPSSRPFIPYLISVSDDWGSYGGSYGGVTYNKGSDYWGLRRSDNHPKDILDFNYFDLGGRRRYDAPEDNHIGNYPGSQYPDRRYPPSLARPDYANQWTRRPGIDECSVKSGEGFRLNKGIVKHAYVAPTVTECERLCFSEDEFICHTYSYRYSTIGRENCLLCDRPINNLDYYVDVEPDRDYDIYSMTDDMSTCRPPPNIGGTGISDPRNNAQCFFRALDATRFFKSIVRDSLTVRSIGECEMECIKSSKFTCRAFSYRYGQRIYGGIIDNCQLSDWPVRDMDKGRHLISDPSFDVFERASYGHGCEIQPIVDEKHKKLCYLGYGSSAKLLSTAIKKVITVPNELECKKECIRYRETTPFKCFSFSFGSQMPTFNCEMSDLDQTELKLNIHYAHTNDRDYWLFAWNPFDWTCRDKVNTIGGNRVNNDRRMDIFRDPGQMTWRHYTVSGKPCRVGSDCDKNLVTGFYSCELEGGEIGSWDYCCKSSHPCGYSKGFEYPWCFVGDEADQWRKCSDRYFPSGSNKTHSFSNNSPSISYSIKDENTKPPSYYNSNQEEQKRPQQQPDHPDDYHQRPPKPDGLQSLSDFTAARLWPVTYLYSEGPPNSTEFSNFVDCNKENC